VSEDLCVPVCVCVCVCVQRAAVHEFVGAVWRVSSWACLGPIPPRTTVVSSTTRVVPYIYDIDSKRIAKSCQLFSVSLIVLLPSCDFVKNSMLMRSHGRLRSQDPLLGRHQRPVHPHSRFRRITGQLPTDISRQIPAGGWWVILHQCKVVTCQ
jgi:hypothetical protein